jgi:hypothetical protein
VSVAGDEFVSVEAEREPAGAAECADATAIKDGTVGTGAKEGGCGTTEVVP